MTVLSQPRSKPAWLKEGAPQGALRLLTNPRQVGGFCFLMA
ncbi:transposase, IS4 family domain protein [Burkholderia pseudomallei TSV28]|nr:transposase, IS4 family domain protein [Burkholderia pseudomallei TSV28]